jgi:hypothetical protein
MKTRWIAAGIGLTGALAACAQGSSPTNALGTGASTTSSATQSTSSGTGGIGGAASSSSGSSTSGSSSSGTGGMGGAASSSGFSTSSSSSSGTPSLCGNGMLDPGEQCDFPNLNGASCQSLGFESGTLQCGVQCMYDTSACVSFPNCSDPSVGCTDPSCAAKPACLDSCGAPFSIMVPGSVNADNTSNPNTLDASCSSATPGPEQIFQVTATKSGRMLADVTPEGNASYSVSVRTACPTTVALDGGAPDAGSVDAGAADAGAGAELGCSAVPNQAFQGDVVVSVPVISGVTYYVVVQGLTTTDFGPYSLSLDFLKPETDCGNFADDDLNGFTDCDDPNCQATSTTCVPGTVVTGQPCGSNPQCTANNHDPVCLDEVDFPQFPNGYCSEFCNVTTQDCAVGNVCYAGLGISQDGVCLHSCTTDADCRTSEGYACVGRGLSTKVCVITPEVLCNDYLDNDSNNLTDCADPNCQTLPACVPGTTAVGQPCSLHGNCTASAGLDNPFCIDEADELYPNGYCSHFCDPTKANDCGAGNSCVPNANLTLFPVPYVCMVSCTQDSQCRVADGYMCIAGVCDAF